MAGRLDSQGEERRRYERDCLEATKTTLAGFAESMRPGQVVRDVRLEGRYPDSRIVVDYWDKWADEDRTIDFALWSPLFEDSQGGREAPDVVAAVIHGNVSERGTG